jgi:hypothetical protein
MLCVTASQQARERHQREPIAQGCKCNMRSCAGAVACCSAGSTQQHSTVMGTRHTATAEQPAAAGCVGALTWHAWLAACCHAGSACTLRQHSAESYTWHICSSTQNKPHSITKLLLRLHAGLRLCMHISLPRKLAAVYMQAAAIAATSVSYAAALLQQQRWLHTMKGRLPEAAAAAQVLLHIATAADTPQLPAGWQQHHPRPLCVWPCPAPILPPQKPPHG